MEAAWIGHKRINKPERSVSSLRRIDRIAQKRVTTLVFSPNRLSSPREYFAMLPKKCEPHALPGV